MEVDVVGVERRMFEPGRRRQAALKARATSSKEGSHEWIGVISHTCGAVAWVRMPCAAFVVEDVGVQQRSKRARRRQVGSVGGTHWLTRVEQGAGVLVVVIIVLVASAFR